MAVLWRDGYRLDTPEKVNIGKLLHLLDVAALYHFLVVEKNPLSASFPGQLLPHKRYVVPRMMLATCKYPLESINLPRMYGDTLVTDDRLQLEHSWKLARPRIGF